MISPVFSGEPVVKERFGKILAISPVKIALMVILAIVVLFFMDISILRFIELKTLDLRMVSHGKVQTSGNVAIAAIDEKSLGELGRWPWPRSVVARLVDSLKGYGARAVGFDIVFAEPDQNSSLQTLKDMTRVFRQSGVEDRRVLKLIEEEKANADTDAILTRSIEKAKNITLGYFFHTARKDIEQASDKALAEGSETISNSRYQMIKSGAVSDDSSIARAYAVVPNLKPVSEVSENSGYFNTFPDSDGVIRWSPLVIKFQDNYYTSLAMGLLIQYLDWPMLTLNIADYGVSGVQLGDIRIPTDESGRLLINYLGPAKTFPHYSITDIIHDRIPADAFRNKIVIIGATAVGIYDLRVTPFSAVYPGVEIHATVIDNILRRHFLVQSGWTKFFDLEAIILSGLIMVLIVSKLKAVQGMIAALVLLCLFVTINTFIFTYYNIWLNMVMPVLTMMNVYLGTTLYRYVTEEREKKKIRGAFQYYLTASVITEMLKDPTKLKLGGDKKELSVLFSDIRGFTTVSESLSPEDLVHLLNEYLTAMTNKVFQYDGLLDKYMGDAIMAVFGAPLNQPDHALRACRTALDMIEELKHLQKKWTDEGRPVLNIGVGVNTGDMVVGNMGSEMRFDYTVMGDSVNLGSRLEGINKEYGTNIVISEFTYTAVKDQLFCRELDSVRVKGKNLPVKIYELLGDMNEVARWQPFASVFEQALAMYRAGRWDEAMALFRKVLEIQTDDPPSQIYIRRCEDLKTNPPPQPWDGVYTMTKK